MEKSSIVGLSIAGLFIFVIGGGLGVVSQKQVDAQALANNTTIQQAIKLAPTAKILSSKAVQAIQIFGQIKKVDGQIITVTNLGEDIAINFSKTAKFYSVVGKTDPKTKQTTDSTQQINFGDLKTGQQISAAIKILSNGQVEGESAFISNPFHE